MRRKRRGIVICTNQRSALIEFSSGRKRAKPEIPKISCNAAQRQVLWTQSGTSFTRLLSAKLIAEEFVYSNILVPPSCLVSKITVPVGEWRQWLTLLSRGRWEMQRWNACWLFWQLFWSSFNWAHLTALTNGKRQDWGALLPPHVKCSINGFDHPFSLRGC